jgi:hypothetical protein
MIVQQSTTPPPAPVPKMEDFVDNMAAPNYGGATVGTSYAPSNYSYDYQDYGFGNPPPDVYQNSQPGYQNNNDNQYHTQYNPYGVM